MNKICENIDINSFLHIFFYYINKLCNYDSYYSNKIIKDHSDDKDDHADDDYEMIELQKIV